MRRFLKCSVTIVILLSAHRLDAQDAAAADRARQIAPYLDDQAVAVGRIDVVRLDVKGLFAQFPAALDREILAEFEAAAVQWVDAFRKAGGQEIYIVVSLADVPEQPPFLIVPLQGAEKVRELIGLLKQINLHPFTPELAPFPACDRVNNVLFAGSIAALVRIRKHTPSPRSGLADAFAAAGNAPVQIVLVPSDDHRRVLREMLGRAPDEAGPPLGPALADGLRWLALGVELPPRLSLRAVIQSANPPAARALAELIEQRAMTAAQIPSVQKILPDAGPLLKRLVPQPAEDRLTLMLDAKDPDIDSLAALRGVPTALVRQVRRRQAVDNLKQIGLGLHNYHDAFGKFPAPASYDAQGKPLLSWRVRILQYVEGGELYNQFHLDEAWDSPHNRKLIARMPAVYRNGDWQLERQGKTTFLAPVGEQTVFSGRDGISIRDIIDGTSNTIMVVDAADDRAVIWTKPEDWEFDPQLPLRGLTGKFDGAFQTLLCDGSVRFVSDKINLETLGSLFTRNGGETVPDF